MSCTPSVFRKSPGDNCFVTTCWQVNSRRLVDCLSLLLGNLDPGPPHAAADYLAACDWFIEFSRATASRREDHSWSSYQRVSYHQLRKFLAERHNFKLEAAATSLKGRPFRTFIEFD